MELDDAEGNREQNLEEHQLQKEELERIKEESRKRKMKSRYLKHLLEFREHGLWKRCIQSVTIFESKYVRINSVLRIMYNYFSAC